MKSTRNLRLRLRLIEGALVLLLGALTTGAVATHQLLLDATNRPTGDVSFSDPHWVGTLDAARLPASVPLLADDNTLAVAGFKDGVYGYSATYTEIGHNTSGISGCALYTNGNVLVDGGTLFCNGTSSLDYGAITTDSLGDIYINTVTLPPFDPVTINAPPTGVTLYTSSTDGRLHCMDAAGYDHTLTITP